MLLPGGQDLVHPLRIRRVPHDRVPVRIHDYCPSARSKHAVNLGQCQVNVANILQYLSRYDRVKVLLREGELQGILTADEA